jgi:hypothetical protein
MKLDVLRKIIREEVKGAIQDELKEILLEAVKSNKQPIQEAQPFKPPTSPESKANLRESYKNILGETAASFNTSQVGQPLQVTSTDTASQNGKLPEGEVSMDQIMGIMNKR